MKVIAKRIHLSLPWQTGDLRKYRRDYLRHAKKRLLGEGVPQKRSQNELPGGFQKKS
jgi:hypothetical protein